MKKIEVLTPTRICDLGGWTDTWFAKQGAVLNIGVFPGVQICVCEEEARLARGEIEIRLNNFDEVYLYDEATIRHPLIDSVVGYLRPYAWDAFSIEIESEVPPGASMGTSASVMVGLIKALRKISLKEVEMSDAVLAHWIEAELLEQQTGVQDQVVADVGGIQFIRIDEYPIAKSEDVKVSPAVLEALEAQLRTIYLGMPHHSSVIHEMVIDKMETDAKFNERFLEALRRCAFEGKEALEMGDLARFGKVMRENTAIQEEMHGELVSEDAKALIAEFDALCWGWKVNGAGGDGGSVSFLVKAEKVDDFEARFAEFVSEKKLLRLFKHTISG